MIFGYMMMFFLVYSMDKSVKYYLERKKKKEELKRLKEIQFLSIPFEWIIVETGEKLIESDIYQEAVMREGSDRYKYSDFNEDLLIYCPVHDCSQYVRTLKQVADAVNMHKKYVDMIKKAEDEKENKKKLEDDARKIEELKKKIKND